MSGFILLFVFFLAYCDSKQVWGQLDKAGWIDPGDLANRKPDETEFQRIMVENLHLRIRISELEASIDGAVAISTEKLTCDRINRPEGSQKNEVIIFKHLIRKLSAKLSSPGFYEADIRLSKRISTIWQEFLALSTVETNNLQEVADTVANLFSRIERNRESGGGMENGYFQNIIDLFRSLLPVLNFCILIPSVGLLLIRLLRISRRQLTLWILFLIFFISVIWTWIHLYKERQAEIQARFARSQSLGDSCTPESNVPVWKAFRRYVSSLFTFTPDDPCIEHFKDIMIDPVWTVTPLEAVSVAVTKFFVRPLEPLAYGLARFWRALLIDLPLTAYCIVLPIMIFTLALIIFACSGYRLRLGFGLVSLEPAATNSHRREAVIENRPAEVMAVTRAGQSVGEIIQRRLIERRRRRQSFG